MTRLQFYREDEWEDQWLDMTGRITEGGEPAHYLGYLFLQTDNDKVFDVIDSQQRLTTMTEVSDHTGCEQEFQSPCFCLVQF